MNLRTQKNLAAKILKAGISRVKVENDPDVAEAITRNDVRNLIKAGLISTIQKKGQCTSLSKKRAAQKKKGRKTSKGSKKGTKNARKNSKTKWMVRIRSIRKMLKEMKEGNQIENADYRKLYKLASGGTFRSKKHVIMYAEDHDMLKGPKPRKKKSADSSGTKAKKTGKTRTAKTPKKKVAANKVKKDA